MIITLSILFIGGAIALYVYQFIWFDQCGGPITQIAISLFFMLLWIALTLLQMRKDASLFTTGFVSLYISYLCWSALTQNMNESCNTFLKSNPNTWAQIWTGLFFTFFGLIAASILTRERLNV